ncbi:YdcF family protein [Limnochorda sp.]|uniref:YdcF family protein n=1 Tax=Limnochorda sp. TaxID=1940279 RepID=UPI0039C187B4
MDPTGRAGGARPAPTPDGGRSRPRRLARALLLALAAALILLGVLAEPLLVGVGHWLARPDPLPASADALVVLSGDPYGLREAEAARLWHQGLAPLVVVTGGPIAWQTVAAEVMARHLEALGVPGEAILVEGRATSTWENAAYTLPLMEAQGARQVVVVTSNYHVRRARLAFRRLYEPAGLQVAVHGAPDPGFHPDGWWQEPLGREYGLLELMKLLWYLVT